MLDDDDGNGVHRCRCWKHHK